MAARVCESRVGPIPLYARRLIDGHSQAEPYRTLLPANLHLVRLVT